MRNDQFLLLSVFSLSDNGEILIYYQKRVVYNLEGNLNENVPMHLLSLYFGRGETLKSKILLVHIRTITCLKLIQCKM